MQQSQSLETPETVAASIRSRLADRRKLDPPLAITAPADCPPGLAAQIAEHNAACESFLERRKAVDAALAALPMMRADPKTTPKSMAGRADALRAEAVALARERIGLIEAAGPLLAAVAAALEARIPPVEEAVEAAKKKTREALKRAGLQTLAALTMGPGRFPDVEERQLDFQVRNSRPVMAAQAALNDAKAALAAVQDRRRRLPRDVATALDALLGAWADDDGAVDLRQPGAAVPRPDGPVGAGSSARSFRRPPFLDAKHGRVSITLRKKCAKMVPRGSAAEGTKRESAQENQTVSQRPPRSRDGIIYPRKKGGVRGS